VSEARRLVSLAALSAALACEPEKAGLPDAASVARAPAPASAVPVAEDPSARMARWEAARSAALRTPCRAIAVDGAVRVETAPDAGAPLALEDEIPSEAWLSVARDSRVVAKDPRTTRETAFVGPAWARACVAHREESWLASGRFESAIGAGETPGAEEWVVTPLGVVRYMAAKIAVEVRAKESVVGVALGDAFLWVDDDVRAAASRGRGQDAGAAPGAAPAAGERRAGIDGGLALDDDGWLRTGEGEVTLLAGARSPIAAARAVVDRCAALGQRSQELAAALLAGSATGASEAKEQMRTRRLARAACAVAALRVDSLPPSAPRGEMSAKLDRAGAAWAAPAGPSSPPP
jgi:hypothetical protein